MGYFLPFYSANSPKKQNFEKNEINTWRFHDFTHVHQKLWSDDVWFLRYQSWWTEFFVILNHFLPFYPSNSPNNQNFDVVMDVVIFHFEPFFALLQPKKSKLWKNEKMPGDIIIYHICNKNYDQMMYSSWGMVRDRCNCYFSFWAIICLFTPLSNLK